MRSQAAVISDAVHEVRDAVEELGDLIVAQNDAITGLACSFERQGWWIIGLSVALVLVGLAAVLVPIFVA